MVILIQKIVMVISLGMNWNKNLLQLVELLPVWEWLALRVGMKKENLLKITMDSIFFIARILDEHFYFEQETRHEHFDWDT